MMKYITYLLFLTLLSCTNDSSFNGSDKTFQKRQQKDALPDIQKSTPSSDPAPSDPVSVDTPQLPEEPEDKTPEGPLTGVLTSSFSGVTSSYPIPVTLTWSGPIKGLSVKSIETLNSVISNIVIEETKVEIELSPTQSGEIKISLPKGAAVGKHGRESEEVAPLSFVFQDANRPTVTIQPREEYNDRSFMRTYDIVFSKKVKGFSQDDILLSEELTIQSFEATETGATITFELSKTQSHGFYVRENAAIDDANLANLASEEVLISYMTFPVAQNIASKTEGTD